ICPDRPENQVEVGFEGHCDRLDASRAGNFEVSGPVSLETDVGDDLFRPGVLVKDFGATVGSERTDLAGLFAVIDRSWPDLEGEIDRLLFKLADLEFHTVSLRRGGGRVKCFAADEPLTGRGACVHYSVTWIVTLQVKTGGWDSLFFRLFFAFMAKIITV